MHRHIRREQWNKSAARKGRRDQRAPFRLEETKKRRTLCDKDGAKNSGCEEMESTIYRAAKNDRTVGASKASLALEYVKARGS